MLNSFKDLSLPSANEIAIALDRAKCENSFEEFVKATWHIIEPSTPLLWGWAMSAICSHLQAVAEGKIKRLCVNVPPGFSKSLLTSVFFPAWLWIKQPHKRIIGTAHSKELAIRDSTKMQTIVESEFFKERWNVRLKDNQNSKSNFANESEGVRFAAAFTKMTGVRGDIVILDDPISAFDANSEAEINNARLAFLETLPSRINNDDSAIIVIMQRLSEKDVTGVIIEKELDYTMLVLPMRFEKDRVCKTDIGFVDPRTEEGELLFPEFFTEERVSALEKSLGAFSTAGQLQQLPIPRGGGLFKREWFDDKLLQAMPNDVRWVRGYDLAAGTKKQHDFTSSALVGMTNDNRIIIADVKNEKLSPNAVRSLIKQTAEYDGQHVRVSIPQDPGQAGLAQTEQFRQDLMGYDFKFSTESGDKQTRALPLAAQAEAGAVYYVKGDWNAAFFDQLCNFPNAKNDDMVDSVTRAFNECLKMNGKKDKNISYYGGIVL